MLDFRFSRVAETRLIGPDGLAQIQSKTAAVLGVGNIGGQAAQHLVLLGTNLLLVDRDLVREENLGTQSFSEREHLGLPKVVARARSLGPLNPACRIETVHADIRHMGRGALGGADAIVCCLDSRSARVMVNELAMRLGVPWVDAALDGTGKTLFGRVAAYDPRAPDAPCYLCPLDRESLRDIQREEAPAGCPSWSWAESEAPTPTRAVSALGGAIAAAAVVWTLKQLLGRSDALGRELYLDLDEPRLSTHALKRNPRCVSDHRAFPRPYQEGRLHESVEETFSRAEAILGGAVRLELQGRSLARRLRCAACHSEKRPYRVLESMTAVRVSCACGGLMEPLASDLLDRFDREDAGEFVEKTWARLGLPRDDIVLAAREDRCLTFLLA
jgi:molybdopterin/thiamine biosynthesis adenylyltransferase